MHRRKYCSLFLVLNILIIALSASCTKDKSIDGALFKIGQLVYTIDGFDKSALGMNRKAIVEAAGGEIISVPVERSPQSMISGVRNLIAQGCDGIIITPVSNSILPQVYNMCEEAAVYWIISMRPVQDLDTKQLLESSAYYVGSVSENDESAAYDIIKHLAENGVKRIATFSISKFDAVVEARELGLRRAAEAYDIEIVEEIRNISSCDAMTKAAGALLEVYPDLDAIFSVATSIPGGAISVLDVLSQNNQVRQVKFTSIDMNIQMAQYFDEGIIPIVAGGHGALDAVVATSLLVNAVTGYPVSENEKVSLTIRYYMLQNSEDVRRICAYDNAPLFSEEDIQNQLLKKNRPTLSLVDYQEIIDLYLSGKLPLPTETRNPFQ